MVRLSICTVIAVLFVVFDILVLASEEDPDREATPEELAELEALQQKKDELAAKLLAMKSEKRQQEMKYLVELQSMLEGLKDDEQSATDNQQEPPAAAAAKDPSLDMVEKLMAGLNAKKNQEQDELKAPIPENDLHACALMSARHYTNPKAANATGSRALLHSFAFEKDTFDLSSAVESKLFRGIAACLKLLPEGGLDKFKSEGGFEPESTVALAEDMANEVEGRQATLLTGDVFQITFDRPRWNMVRRVYANMFAEDELARDEL